MNEDWLAVIAGVLVVIALFASATVVNIVVALGLAVVLFGSFEVS